MKLIASIFFALFLTQSFGQSSILSEGQWVKYVIRENGMYRLRGTDLQAAGISLENVSPGQIHVAGFPGGALDQLLENGEPPRLSEMAIMVLDGNDGSFDPEDLIVFYAEGAHHVRQKTDGPEFSYNPYSQVNFLFVGVSNDPAKRVDQMDPMSSPAPEITTFKDIQFYKTSENNLLESGRKWYGRRLQTGQSEQIDFNIPDLATGGNVTITSAVMAQSFSLATFTFSWQGSVIGQQEVNPVPDFLNPPSNNPFRYSVKGREEITSFTFPVVSGGETRQLDIGYEASGSGRSVGFIDYILVEADRNLVVPADQLLFAGKGPGKYELTFSESPPMVWDITSFFDAEELSASINATTLSFEDSRADQRQYAAFIPELLPVPEFIGPVAGQDLPGGSAADLVIVTHPDFLGAANTLAQHRAQFSQLTVAVVTTEQVYNEYAGGKQDVSAIRNYAREQYLKGTLDHILLIGKGTFDYLDILNVTANYVPTYQSRNSLDPLDSYASDDFYGFLEAGEGEWLEVSGGNHSLDIGVGRLAVTTPEQAAGVVQKIIRYDLDKKNLGEWRTRLVFVADDEDFNLHHRQAERLATFSDSTYVDFRKRKIYLGAFEQEAGAGGQTIPEASEMIDRSISDGALVVNYTGHGGENGWAQEQVLTKQMIRSWRNTNKLPLFVTATCEFGRHDNPREESGGELVVNSPNGGGIALLSTGRPVFSSSNFSVNQAFYDALFRFEDGEVPAFGSIFKKTKNESIDDAIDINKVGNRNFTLLGDPSQQIAHPRQGIRLLSLTGDGEATDTLKAGSRIRIEAEITTAGGTRDVSFTGTADLFVTDKPVDRQTLDAPVFNYETRENILFKGKATVTDGLAAFEFIVPRNISQKPGTGRIQLYAQADQGDALGAADSIFIGGTSAIPGQDTQGPDIAVFFGDSTNTSRNDVNDNTLLFVSLKDDSGINTSGFGVGNNLTGILDGSSFVMNEYYTAKADDYSAGWIVYPLSDLEKGRHTLTIRAWDVFNNSNEITVEFIVADPGTLVVKNVMNYPNPVIDQTIFRFDHNRAGETLEVEWMLIGDQGQFIEKRTFLIEDSPSRVELVQWDRSKNLTPGIYFFSVVVRSTLDGATAKKYQKLILID